MIRSLRRICRLFFSKRRGRRSGRFSDCVNDRTHQFGRHPEDYALFELGDFDDASGAFSLHHVPVIMGNAIEFLKPSTGAN